jgi:deoxyribose-phosphate aldolase
MEGSGIPVMGLLNFPGGLASTKVKVYEAVELLNLGVDGLDGVINYQALRSGDYDFVKRELCEIVEAARQVKPDAEIKFIIETTLLTREQIMAGARLVKESGANFVKTSTGWRGGCTLEQVRILREAVGPDFGVKAAGGHIATTEKALAMLEAGADIIGENNCCQIMEGYDLLIEKRSRS